MEFAYLYSASGRDYSEVFSHYQVRELTQDEIASGMYANCIITFNSLDELIHFENEVGDIIICDRWRPGDDFWFKAIIIYDDYLE